MSLAQGHFSSVDGSQNRGLNQILLLNGVLCKLLATPNIGFGNSWGSRQEGEMEAWLPGLEITFWC